MSQTKNKLSHSAASRFQTCPKSYEYHYIQKLRPKLQSSALLFGSAVDVAIGAMLQPEKGKNPEQIFNYFWNFADVNKVKTYLPTCIDIVYSDSDGDKDLVSEKHAAKLVEAYGDNWYDQVKEIQKHKDHVGFKYLNKSEKTILNHYNWSCLHAKGLLMLEAVRAEVLPKIEKVLATQAYVKLENTNGDSVIGYADLVCKFYEYNSPLVLDFKTSSIDYKVDSVLTSPQLTLYVHALSEKYENTRRAGFIVLHKRIEKNKTKVCSSCGHDGTGQRHKTCDQIVNEERCNGVWKETISPKCRVQIITDEIPPQTENIVLENMDDINKAIKNGSFIRNLNSCIQPWGKCSYWNLCYKGKDDELVKMDTGK